MIRKLKRSPRKRAKLFPAQPLVKLLFPPSISSAAFLAALFSVLRLRSSAYRKVTPPSGARTLTSRHSPRPSVLSERWHSAWRHCECFIGSISGFLRGKNAREKRARGKSVFPRSRVDTVRSRAAFSHTYPPANDVSRRGGLFKSTPRVLARNGVNSREIYVRDCSGRRGKMRIRG